MNKQTTPSALTSSVSADRASIFVRLLFTQQPGNTHGIYHCGVSRARRGRFTFNAYGQLPDIGFTVWPKGHKRINGLAK
jgi:hypothetical protein